MDAKTGVSLALSIPLFLAPPLSSFLVRCKPTIGSCLICRLLSPPLSSCSVWAGVKEAIRGSLAARG